MDEFSKRNGVFIKNNSYNNVEKCLRNRIWNFIYYEDLHDDWIDPFTKVDKTQLNFYLCDRLGITLSFYDSTKQLKQIEVLRKWIINCDWYQVYDFIEIYLSFFTKKEQKYRIKELNKILIEETSLYRVCENGLVIPITNDTEIESIIKTSKSKYIDVNIAIEKAIKLLSDKKNPDYENSIKESISAVEALCCQIIGEKKTLGDALNYLKKYIIDMHPSMLEAMKKLYGYTSDASGIRHSTMDFTNAKIEDARYMLVICSAFINYVIEKLEVSNEK